MSPQSLHIQYQLRHRNNVSFLYWFVWRFGTHGDVLIKYSALHTSSRCPYQLQRYS